MLYVACVDLVFGRSGSFFQFGGDRERAAIQQSGPFWGLLPFPNLKDVEVMGPETFRAAIQTLTTVSDLLPGPNHVFLLALIVN